jgi:hypothetical protein
MLGIYCRDKHESSETLCPECREVLDYAAARLAECPFGEKKPTCAQCTIHCYKPDMRERAREIMKYSGPRMLRAHPVMAVRHLVQGVMRKPSRKAATSK